MIGATDYGRAKAAECKAKVGPARLSVSINGLEILRAPVWQFVAIDSLRFQTPRRIANRLKPGTVYDCALTLPDGQVVRFQEEMPELEGEEP